MGKSPHDGGRRERRDDRAVTWLTGTLQSSRGPPASCGHRVVHRYPTVSSRSLPASLPCHHQAYRTPCHVITRPTGLQGCHRSSRGLPGSPRALVIIFGNCHYRFGRASTVITSCGPSVFYFSPLTLLNSHHLTLSTPSAGLHPCPDSGPVEPGYIPRPPHVCQPFGPSRTRVPVNPSSIHHTPPNSLELRLNACQHPGIDFCPLM